MLLLMTRTVNCFGRHPRKEATAMTISTPPIISTVSMPDANDAALLTLSEAAAILRVPVNTLRWWRQQGTGPTFFKIGRNLVTTVGDLRRWIEEQKQGGNVAHPGVS